MSEQNELVDLRGMSATYDPDRREFSVVGISAKDAHSLIWRGGRVTERIVVALRQALVAAQDEIPEDHYTKAADEADADEREERR